MYLTVDCAQFESGKIAFYEFCNSEMTNLIHYSLEKFNLLSKIADITYLVCYSIEKNRAVVYQSGRDSFGDKETIIDGNIQDFNKWYSYKNNVKNKDGKNPSKPFGDILSGGDPYVEKILNQLEDLDFDVLEDYNGRDIIIPALSEVSTYFFDVDLFNVENNDVIEFLKNDSEEKKKAGKQKWSVTNANAHPNRYWWNKQKFINLYDASRHINGNLWLVNYSDNPSEKVSLISVTSIDNEKGITSDVGYLLSYKELLEWLLLNQQSSGEGLAYLETKPKQERNEEFWLEEHARKEARKLKKYAPSQIGIYS